MKKLPVFLRRRHRQKKTTPITATATAPRLTPIAMASVLSLLPFEDFAASESTAVGVALCVDSVPLVLSPVLSAVFVDSGGCAVTVHDTVARLAGVDDGNCAEIIESARVHNECGRSRSSSSREASVNGVTDVAGTSVLEGDVMNVDCRLFGGLDAVAVDTRSATRNNTLFACAMSRRNEPGQVRAR